MRRRGTVLVTVIGISVISFILAASTLGFLQSRYSLLGSASQRVQLAYIANAGIQVGAYYVRTRTNPVGTWPPAPNSPYAFGGGNVSITIAAALAAGQYDVVATANAEGKTKTITALVQKTAAPTSIILRWN
jgi:hypothetical protein